jgi:serine/threonine-protein kinase
MMESWSARADLTAMRFGQYELFDRFAVGDMAELYMGRALGEEGFEKPVAIKRILPHLAADERFVRMLLTEARIHASLSHKNIVQIHDLQPGWPAQTPGRCGRPLHHGRVVRGRAFRA